MLERITQNKLGLGAVSLAVLLGIAVFVWAGGKTTAYSVAINGKTLLVADDRDAVQGVVDEIIDQKSKEMGRLVTVSTPITYNRTIAKNNQVAGDDEIREKLIKELDFRLDGAVILVNDREVAYTVNDAQAKAALRDAKAKFSAVKKGEKVISLRLGQKVAVKSKNISIEQVMTKGEIVSLLTTGQKTPVLYTVKNGDNLWAIARKHDMHVREIKSANSLKNERLRNGQVLTLSVMKPIITVEATIEGSGEETIPFMTKIVSDPKAKSPEIRQTGKNGLRQVAYRLKVQNGAVIDRKVLSQKIITQPVDQVVARGKRERAPIMVASRGGSFIGGLAWPISAGISSPFGGRRGHTGLDLDGDTGDAIHAAKDGIVTFVGREGAYGQMIVVTHDNGIKTRYAHCSKMLVNVGQKVTQGQTIGKVGTTGRTTGSHLHFEVIKDGVFQNPIRFLR